MSVVIEKRTSDTGSKLGVTAIASVLLLASTAHSAEPLNLVQTANPLSVAAEARGFAIDGLKIGAPAQETMQELRRRWGQASVSSKTDVMSMTSGGRSVTSVPFLASALVDAPNGTTVRLSFSPPSIGSVVVGIQRHTFYGEGFGPTRPIEAAIAEFDQMFGSESYRSTRNNYIVQTWVFDAKSRRDCSVPCITAAAELELTGLDFYKQQMAIGRYLVVSAFITRADDNPAMAKMISVDIEDRANDALALTEAMKQLRSAMDAAEK